MNIHEDFPTGKTTISNDGATIMKLLDIVHPAAKTLVDISLSQDAEVGAVEEHFVMFHPTKMSHRPPSDIYYYPPSLSHTVPLNTHSPTHINHPPYYIEKCLLVSIPHYLPVPHPFTSVSMLLMGTGGERNIQMVVFLRIWPST